MHLINFNLETCDCIYHNVNIWDSVVTEHHESSPLLDDILRPLRFVEKMVIMNVYMDILENFMVLNYRNSEHSIPTGWGTSTFVCCCETLP